jgi:signal transduction histidine kinase
MSAIYLKTDFKEVGEIFLNQIRKYFNFERIEIDFTGLENKDRLEPDFLKRMVEKGNIYDEKFLRWWEREKINIVNDVYENKKPFIIFKDKDNKYKISGSDNFNGNPVLGIILPLISESKIFGFVSMLSAKPVRYSYDDLRLPVIITHQTTVAMENISLNKKKQKLALSEERNRLARDLHDNTAQLLATFLMQLSLYKELIFKDPQKVIEGIGKLERLIANILTQSHYFIFSPENLELKDKPGMNLVENLEEIVNDFYDKFSLKINLGINGDTNSLSIAVQVGVLPIIRELLYNIARHAYVKEADIKVNILSGRLEIVVEDCGCGFNPGFKKEQAGKQKHLGLFSVEERSKALGGSVVFETVIGVGTKAVLTVPVG